ncbi:monooxygenase FAD-binding protein [Desulfurococcus mucosus DSM 2162]|uniref:Monooxygenase FAD-binding protein n=1 Tax=Desulfurococcus mucosus (strain ATCC 35584 / DSM 2162 / JCM 9187 / O7/1) TaxID=765177 RepID=E8R7I9_DESM0|nr:monooxygenase FAD-binding protein [Desulfurococcus mucosus DSM 2162]
MVKADVCIVGAGPAGLSVASHLKLRDAVVIEEHGKPGIPKHCSGLVGVETARLIEKYVGRVVDSSYNTVYFNAFGRLYKVSYRDDFVFHVNRPLLEEKLSSLVERKGHRVSYGVVARPRGVDSILAGGVEFKCNTLLIAEGAVGRFRRFFVNPYSGFIIGIQSLFRVRNIEMDSIYIYYSEFTPGFFSWIIPLDQDTALIGGGFTRVDAGLVEKATRRVVEAYGVRLGGVVERFGGIIPMQRPIPDPVIAGKAVFHGDSVPLIKPYTGGGLHYIFKLSERLARHIDEGDIAGYRGVYSKSIRGLLLEHQVVSILRSTLIELPVPFVAGLNKLNLFKPPDYDKHHLLLVKSVPLMLTGLLPFLAGATRLEQGAQESMEGHVKLHVEEVREAG